MNAKRMYGKVLLFLGVAISLYGGFQAVSNQPEAINYTEWQPASAAARERASQRDQLEKENSRRHEEQQVAIRILVVGLIVTVVGLYISDSARRGTSTI